MAPWLVCGGAGHACDARRRVGRAARRRRAAPARDDRPEQSAVEPARRTARTLQEGVAHTTSRVVAEVGAPLAGTREAHPRGPIGCMIGRRGRRSDGRCGGRDRSWRPSRAASITRKVGRLAPPPTGCPCSERLKRRAKLWLSAGTLLDLIDLPLYKHPVNQPPTSSDQPKPPTTNPNPNHRTPVLTPCPTPYVGGHLPTTTNHQAPNTTNHEHPPHTSPQAQNVNYQLPTTNSHSSHHPFI